MKTIESIPEWLAEEWRRRLALAIEALTGESVAIEQQESRGIRDELSLASLYPTSAGEGCALWAASSGSAWETIGRRALEAAGLQEAGLEDVRKTYHEILAQACSGVAEAIGERLGREVTLGEAAPSEKPPAGAPPLRFAVRFPASAPVVMLVAVSGPLLALLAGPAPGMAETPCEETSASKTLDLLLEVELPVSVSFGRTEIPFKDVVKLSTGSILELNRAVSEPVEIIVNNCVIARGEVVVIEGNYGVRVTQVISRQERLRTLY